MKLSSVGRIVLFWFGICVLANAQPNNDFEAKSAKFPDVKISSGIYTIYHEKALSLLDLDANLKTLANGFKWAEGPLWIDDGDFLLFSDIPNNKVYKYAPDTGLSLYLADSGYSNGLVYHDGQLILLQSRSRVISTMRASLAAPTAHYQTMVSHFQSKQLNSPNDGVVHKSGALFFTDPPYGLPKQMDDPAKQLAFQGVYQLTPGIEDSFSLNLIDKELSFPNGIALSPDHDVLYVAVSDTKQPAWFQYQLNDNGQVINKSLFYEPSKSANEHGVPDGLKVHSSGVVFATGPGGVWLIDADQTLLAHIAMPGFTANLAFDANEQHLYLTAADELRLLLLKH